MDITTSTAEYLPVVSAPSIVRGDLLRARKAQLSFKIADIRRRGANFASSTISSILAGGADHNCRTVYQVGLALGLRGEFTFSPFFGDSSFASLVAGQGRYSRRYSQERQRWIVVELLGGEAVEVAVLVNEDLARVLCDALNHG
jgi:hypothetical protein